MPRPARAFYNSVGIKQVAVHDGAVAEARKLKPEIPEYDEAGTAIKDEIEYDWILR